jgi:hypothetical protein
MVGRAFGRANIAILGEFARINKEGPPVLAALSLLKIVIKRNRTIALP